MVCIWVGCGINTEISLYVLETNIHGVVRKTVPWSCMNRYTQPNGTSDK